MVEVMRWALAAGRLQEGAVTDFWQPSDVFHMATLGAAKALGLDHQLGSLTLDKKADVVLFDFRRAHLTPALNPLGTLVHVAQGRDINMVIVDGRVVVEHGEPVLVDAQRIREDGTAAARRLWNRISGHPLVAPVQQRS
jgi:5-methylthioadenosine/S-adenosylhomocysteine deaminase